jgi:hypothetical protein
VKEQSMKKLVRSVATAAVTLASALTLSAGLASTAYAGGSTPPWEPDASSVGSLTFYNAQGAQITGGNITDAPLAAYVVGSSSLRSGDTKATLFGYLPVSGQLPGQWSGEAISASTNYPNGSAPGALGTSALPTVSGTSSDETVSVLQSDFPNLDSSSDGYAGIYQLRLKTSATGKTQTSTYDSADIKITGSTWSVVYPSPSLTSTVTALQASPASPQVQGTSVTLTATVTPPAPGTVQFEVGSTPIGSPVSVSGGTASIATTSLPLGTDSLSAIYTPAAFAAYAGSTGTASFTVTVPPAADTVTGLSVNPSSAPADTAVSITASLANENTSAALAAGSGQVKFYDDGTDSSGLVTSNSVLLGTVAVGSGGNASLPYNSFAVGTHYLVASFVPSDPTVYNASTSLALDFTSTVPAVLPASQSIDVNIPTGALTITTPYSSANPFALGTAVLNANATQFSASAPFGSSANPSQGVTITDTRAGDLPWTASASVTDFIDGSGDVINGQNLSFTSVTPSYVAGNALQAGSVLTNDVTNSGSVYAATASGSSGLKGGPHTFATAAAGAGSVYIYGVLNLVAPTSTPGGSYSATLTFTVS